MEIKLTDDIGLGNISSYSFYNTLNQNKIKTVSDLLNEEKMDGILKRCRSAATRNQLLGFIDLVRHELYGNPLPADLYLEQLFSPPNKDDNTAYLTLMRMGFTERQATSIIYHAKHKVEGTEGIRMIDVFEAIPSKYYDFYGHLLERKINIYIDAYKNQEKDTTLENLTKELDALKDQRSKLDLKIAKVESSIEAIKEAKGSVTK